MPEDMRSTASVASAAVNRPAHADLPDRGEETALASTFEVLWNYATTLRNTAMLGAVAVVLFVTIGWLTAPTEQFGTVRFRMVFDGAAKGEYPDGSPFSASEILATPVLSAVYAANDLQRYMTLESFRQSMVVVNSGLDQELLRSHYVSKLADTRLLAADRARIEEEYRAASEKLKSADFSLTLRRSERTRALPDTLLGKIFGDTLEEWARQTRERPRLARYDIPVFSRNILEPAANDDYIIAVDILRTRVVRILQNLERILGSIPHAPVMRAGKNKESLPETGGRLRELLRFDIKPVAAYISTARLTKDPLLARSYVRQQLMQARLDRLQSQQRLKALQEAFRDYASPSSGREYSGSFERVPAGPQAPLYSSPVIPQLGESFLQQIVRLSEQSHDARYRQELTNRVIDAGLKFADSDEEVAYYEDLNASVSQWTKSTDSPEVRQLMTKLDRATQAVAERLDDVNANYRALNLNSLDASTPLYTVTVPVSVRSERAVTLRRLLTSGAAGFVLLMALVVVACFAHYYFGTVADDAVKERDQYERV